MFKGRILVVLERYPQISETYIRTELNVLSQDYDLAVISTAYSQGVYDGHLPFHHLETITDMLAAARLFQPHILHTHYLHEATVLHHLAEQLQIPYTVRTHSYDVLNKDPDYLARFTGMINSDLCLGLLAFPFVRPLLEAVGFHADKIIDCFPVVDVQAFMNRSPNGEGVMNTGACLPKKDMSKFFELALKVPGRPFSLYAVNYDLHKLQELNRSMGSPVLIADPPIQPQYMPAEYKKNQWLVYTAHPRILTVGWPMAIAEAQAAGVGVCMPHIRPELRTYLGDGAFLFDTYDEVARHIRQPYSQELREQGFALAQRADIHQHKHLLTDLWQPHLPAQPVVGRSQMLENCEGVPTHRTSLLDTLAFQEKIKAYPAMINLVRHLLRDTPDDPVLWGHLGTALQAQNQPQRALTAWAEAARLSPDPGPYQWLAARLLLNRNAPLEALWHMRGLTGEEPVQHRNHILTALKAQQFQMKPPEGESQVRWTGLLLLSELNSEIQDWLQVLVGQLPQGYHLNILTDLPHLPIPAADNVTLSHIPELPPSPEIALQSFCPPLEQSRWLQILAPLQAFDMTALALHLEAAEQAQAGAVLVSETPVEDALTALLEQSYHLYRCIWHTAAVKAWSLPMVYSEVPLHWFALLQTLARYKIYMPAVALTAQ
jgi:hypothetical protein